MQAFIWERYVLLRKPVRENCTERREFCEAFHRTHIFQSETIFCEQKYGIECPEEEPEIEGEEENVVVKHLPKHKCNN